jgi:hypothetical protein
VSLNIDGAHVERESGRPVLAALHGAFSLGTVIGAVVGIACTELRVSVVWHLVIVGAVVAVGVVVATPLIPAGFGIASIRRGETAPNAEGAARSLLRDPVLIMIGVIVLAMALAEGTANDWLPLLMVD